jgi:hypothetical protein
MAAGLRHWPPLRPRRAAKAAAQGSATASAASRFTGRKDNSDRNERQ